MKEDIYTKTSLLLGSEAVEKLKAAKAAVVGLGGVGGAVSEALVRSGVGALLLIDFDVISETNLNRQILACRSALGVKKTEAAKKRIADINPTCKVSALDIFIDEKTLMDENITKELLSCDFIIDAIDTVSAKAALALFCEENSLKEISCMGTGNKTDITRLKVCDIYSTHEDPLARAVRSLLKKKGVKKLNVVFSDETPAVRPPEPASMIFVPQAAGLMAAREAIAAIIKA